ncbi:transferase [Nemania sp. NC0429]|nr:transferase [Nemania sp. NC0429]
MANEKSRVQSTRRIFPATPSKNITRTKLSIVDATTARFTPCRGIWFFDGTRDFNAKNHALFERMGLALSQTLDDYPHFSGHLQFATADMVAGDINPRHIGRLVVNYGTEDDPGLELAVVQDDRELASVVPDRNERATTKKVWVTSDFPQDDFLASTAIAFSSLAEYVGLPGVAVQFTAFKCGGFAVSVKAAHCLADATSLLHFVRSWAARSRQLFDADALGAGGLKEKALQKPIFKPAQLDEYARLSAPANEPDMARISHARSLPMHRYDWWAFDAPGYPSWAIPTTNVTKPPPEELRDVTLSPSTHAPWPTWDLSVPIEHVQIHFSAREVANMKRATGETLPVQGQVASRQDALLAHLWILINRARRLQDDTEQVYLNLTLGLRHRLSPPLPENFVGSPVLLTYITQTGSTVATAKIGEMASSIRRTMSLFTPQAVSDYLYDAAHEVSPQRLWQAFLGTRHVLVTSWVRTKAWEIDFCGTHQIPRYMQGVMPNVDGLLRVIDIAETGDFDVGLALEKGAMQRLLSDPLLRSFED